MAAKGKTAPRKKDSPRKRTVRSSKKKPPVFPEIKKVLAGIAILIAVCLTLAMVADLFFQPGRLSRIAEKRSGPKSPAPSQVQPVQDRTPAPKEKKPVLAEKLIPAEKPDIPKTLPAIPEDPEKAPELEEPDMPGKKEKPEIQEKKIKYEIFEGVDEQTVEKPSPGIRDTTPRIAIIIDDIGYDRQIALDLMALNSNITFSILPFSPYGKEISEKLNRMGAEIMLHLPMEPVGYPAEDPGPGALLTSMAPDLLLEQLKKNLRDIPHISGVNNHMGSELTAHADQMNQIFSILKKEGLFFIDSRTSLRSQARSSARLLKLRFAHRDVFLDNHQDVEYISGQIRELVRLARKNSYAVGIGHPYKATLTALSREMPRINSSVKVVRAGELARVPED